MRELHARGDALEEPRDDEGTHAEPVALVEQPRRTSCGAVENVNTTQSMPYVVDDVLEVPARTEHGERQRAAVVDRLLVEEAHGVEAELRVRPRAGPR